MVCYAAFDIRALLAPFVTCLHQDLLSVVIKFVLWVLRSFNAPLLATGISRCAQFPMPENQVSQCKAF